MAERNMAGQPSHKEPWSLEGYNRVPRPMRLEAAPRTLEILILYSRPPLPMTRGDELTVSHLLEFLHARGHIVDLITLCSQGYQPRPDHKAWLETRTRNLRFIEQSKLEAIREALLGLFKGWPVQVGFLFSGKQLKAALQAVQEHDYDLAYAYLLRSSEILRRLEGKVGARILALQVSQTLNTRRLAENAARPWERLFYRLESHLMGAYESRIWQGLARTVLIGRKDVAAIEAACRAHGQPPIDNVVYGPHGVDIEHFRPRPEAEEDDVIVMSGAMRYAPNVAAALWFIEHVWPTIRKARPQARFYLVGAEPQPALLAHDGKDGITVTGTVDDPATWIAKAAVSVVPIRAAAGLQNKLLEAMAMARPVVATPEANEGIRAEPGRDFLEARDPEPFAKAVLDLLADPARRHELGQAGRTFIEAKWTWQAPFMDLEQAFLEAAEKTEAGRTVLPATPAISG